MLPLRWCAGGWLDAFLNCVQSDVLYCDYRRGCIVHLMYCTVSTGGKCIVHLTYSTVSIGGECIVHLMYCTVSIGRECIVSVCVMYTVSAGNVNVIKTLLCVNR